MGVVLATPEASSDVRVCLVTSEDWEGQWVWF